MSIELPATVEEELRQLAVVRKRAMGELAVEAIRQYLDAAAITDVDEADLAEAQTKLAGELAGIPD